MWALENPFGCLSAPVGIWIPVKMAPNAALMAHTLQKGLTPLFFLPHSHRWLLFTSMVAAGVWIEHSDKPFLTCNWMGSCLQSARMGWSSDAQMSQAAQAQGSAQATSTFSAIIKGQGQGEGRNGSQNRSSSSDFSLPRHSSSFWPYKSRCLYSTPISKFNIQALPTTSMATLKSLLRGSILPKQ